MDVLKTTPLYTSLVAQQKLPQLDRFAAETGFDPRRDVREILVASNPRMSSAVLLARGQFHVAVQPGAKQMQYRGYNIVMSPKEDAGFCVMDATLAIAGPVMALKSALDQYKSPDRQATAALIARARAVPMQYQVWAVSLGGADILANALPREGNASNFAKIFRSLRDTSFVVDLSHGLNANAEGSCQTDADAKNLSDAARGLVGFGRLSVPESQPELLRIWDGIHVEQIQRKITIALNIPQELIQKLVQFFEAGPGRPGKMVNQ